VPSDHSELKINLYNQDFYALFDTSESVFAISEDTCNVLQKNLLDGQSLNILLVNGVIVSTALQTKSKKVTSQVFLSFIIANQEADCLFLVVSNLSVLIILNDDWLSRYKVILNYQMKIIQYSDWYFQCPVQVRKKTTTKL